MIGSIVENFATAWMVVMVRDVVLTPGLMVPKEAFCASLMEVWVRFQTTGKEKTAPWASGPVGSEALETWKVPSAVAIPASFVIAIREVQVTVWVEVFPIATSPNSTG